MESVLRKIQRPIQVNGELISVQELIESVKEGQELSLCFPAVQPKKLERNCQQKLERDFERDDETHSQSEQKEDGLKINRTYIIKVRQYMTKPATLKFDFHTKWNNNQPMPFRVMQGKVIKETPGMVHMECQVVPMETETCMRCGRRLSHPVSKLYGIGPECGGHAHINPFQTEEELYAALDTVKEQLANITWKGWIIKSAIEEYEEVKE